LEVGSCWVVDKRSIKISIGVISLIQKVSLGLFLIARHPARDSAGEWKVENPSGTPFKLDAFLMLQQVGL
jgi:hypothetical protein